MAAWTALSFMLPKLQEPINKIADADALVLGIQTGRKQLATLDLETEPSTS